MQANWEQCTERVGEHAEERRKKFGGCLFDRSALVCARCSFPDGRFKGALLRNGCEDTWAIDWRSWRLTRKLGSRERRRRDPVGLACARIAVLTRGQSGVCRRGSEGGDDRAWSCRILATKSCDSEATEPERLITRGCLSWRGVSDPTASRATLVKCRRALAGLVRQRSCPRGFAAGEIVAAESSGQDRWRRRVWRGAEGTFGFGVSWRSPAPVCLPVRMPWTPWVLPTSCTISALWLVSLAAQPVCGLRS